MDRFYQISELLLKSLLSGASAVSGAGAIMMATAKTRALKQYEKLTTGMQGFVAETSKYEENGETSALRVGDRVVAGKPSVIGKAFNALKKAGLACVSFTDKVIANFENSKTTMVTPSDRFRPSITKNGVEYSGVEGNISLKSVSGVHLNAARSLVSSPTSDVCGVSMARKGDHVNIEVVHFDGARREFSAAADGWERDIVASIMENGGFEEEHVSNHHYSHAR